MPSLVLASLLLCAGCSADPVPAGAAAVQLPDGIAGIGLDDLRFARALGRLVSPAGRTGKLDLVDPDTLALTSIDGFTASPYFNGGDQQGIESADEGRGLVFTVDRTLQRLLVADPAAARILTTVQLDATEPDYVRWVEATSEVWITRPGRGRIDVMMVPADAAPTPVFAASIAIPGGTEGLTIDNARRRAYTHGGGGIVVIDLDSRQIVATWPDGCSGTHGIPALDDERGFLYSGCGNAEVSVLDLRDGSVLGHYALGPGASIVAFAPALHHLYLRGDGFAPVAILGVSSAGVPTLLGTVDATAHGHCMAADDGGNLWVCDRDAGRLLRFPDTYPAID